jgi:hypothetical protein
MTSVRSTSATSSNVVRVSQNVNEFSLLRVFLDNNNNDDDNNNNNDDGNKTEHKETNLFLHLPTALPSLQSPGDQSQDAWKSIEHGQKRKQR